MKNKWHHLARIPWCIAILAIAVAMGTEVATAQVHTVRGTVVSAEDNQPLPAVNIVEMGTLNGTSSDVDGTFSITDKRGQRACGQGGRGARDEARHRTCRIQPGDHSRRFLPR